MVQTISHVVNECPVESDLRPLNIGPSCAWKKAAAREHWHSTVDTDTLKDCSQPTMLQLTGATCLQCFDTVGWAAGRASGL